MTARSGTPHRGYDDNGGVHTNSGVGNKAAYLIADGGTSTARQSPASTPMTR